MTIREVVQNDAFSLSKIALSLSQFYLAEGDLPKWLSTSLQQEEFIKRINDPSFLTLVYEIKGDIVGYISMQNNDHICHLFVTKTQQQKGIATKLWKKAQALCQMPKYTVRSSIYAIPIYVKFGFIKTAPVETKDNLQFQCMEFIK